MKPLRSSSIAGGKETAMTRRRNEGKCDMAVRYHYHYNYQRILYQ